MIFYWLALGLNFFAPSIITLVGVMVKRTSLLKVGILGLLYALSLMIYFFNIDNPTPLFDSLLFVSVFIEIIILLSTQNIIRLLVHGNQDLYKKNVSLTENISNLTEPNANLGIKLKSKAFLLLEDIYFIKSDGPYLEYYIANQNYPEIDRNSLKKVMPFLEENDFIQVYRSIVVNQRYIERIENKTVFLNNGTELPFSKYYAVR